MICFFDKREALTSLHSELYRIHTMAAATPAETIDGAAHAAHRDAVCACAELVPTLLSMPKS
jgi:hypothetical protein